METGNACLVCGRQTRAHRDRPGSYCSNACYQQDRTGKYRKPDVKHRLVRAKDHPVSPKSGMVALARIVLYDAIGEGPHPCHWCGNDVEWMPGRGLAPGALVVDHLDHDPTNDALENLVPACSVCNAGRTQGAAKNKNLIGSDELFVVAASGRRARAEVRTCETCGGSFIAKTAQVKVGKGRFCCRSCARKAKREQE